MRNPELLLYDAHCNADGISEGRFDVTDERPAAKNRYMEAIKTIQKYLDRKVGVKIGISGIAFSLEDAVIIENHCQKTGADITIKLANSKDGRIVFGKIARFVNYDESQIGEITDELMKLDLIKSYMNKNYLTKKLLGL